MCFDADARPPIDPIAGAPIETELLTLTAADGAQFAAFLAMPRQPSSVGVIILPDIRGLHTYYEELAVHFAEHGYTTIANDYFGRTAGIGHGEERNGDFDWQTHVAQTKANQIAADTAAAIDRLKAAGVTTFFTVGFCFGGSNSWLQAANGLGVAGAIGFYGRPLGPTRDGSPAPIDRAEEYTAPLLGLFGGADAGIPANRHRRLRRSAHHRRQAPRLHHLRGCAPLFLRPPLRRPSGRLQRRLGADAGLHRGK